MNTMLFLSWFVTCMTIGYSMAQWHNYRNGTGYWNENNNRNR